MIESIVITGKRQVPRLGSWWNVNYEYEELEVGHCQGVTKVQKLPIVSQKKQQQLTESQT